MVRAGEIYKLLDSIFPFSSREEWDNSGLLIDSGAETEKVIVCLDVTSKAVETAVKKGAKIIVSHHPVIFGGIKSLDKEDVVYKLIKNDISVISAHTNFDKYEKGTCYAMAEKLGVEQIYDENIEIGLKAKTEQITTRRLAEKCKCIFGNASFTLPDKVVENIFICAGSGGGMVREVMSAGVDCFITGESKYHDMLDLAQLGISVICVGHDASEKVSLYTIEKIIKENFENTEVEVVLEDNIQHYI